MGWCLARATDDGPQRRAGQVPARWRSHSSDGLGSAGAPKRASAAGNADCECCRSRRWFRSAPAPQAQARHHRSDQAHDSRGSRGTSQTRLEPSSRFRGDTAVPSPARSAEPPSDFGARLVRWKRMVCVLGARRCLTFELSGPHRIGAWPAGRMMNHSGKRAKCQAGGGPLERRVRPHLRLLLMPDGASGSRIQVAIRATGGDRADFGSSYSPLGESVSGRA